MSLRHIPAAPPSQHRHRYGQTAGSRGRLTQFQRWQKVHAGTGKRKPCCRRIRKTTQIRAYLRHGAGGSGDRARRRQRFFFSALPYGSQVVILEITWVRCGAVGPWALDGAGRRELLAGRGPGTRDYALGLADADRTRDFFRARQDGKGSIRTPGCRWHAEARKHANVLLWLVWAGCPVPAVSRFCRRAHGPMRTSALSELESSFSACVSRACAPMIVRPVQDNELINSSIQAIVSGLAPHSSYMASSPRAT